MLGKEVVEDTGHFVLLKGQTKHTPLLKFDNKLPTTHISRKRLAKLRNVGYTQGCDVNKALKMNMITLI